MKTIYMLEEFEIRQLLKGRTVDVGGQFALVISPDANADGLRSEVITKKERTKSELTRDQKYKMRKNITNKGNVWVCALCPGKGGWKSRSGVTMHYMQKHIKGWGK